MEAQAHRVLIVDDSTDVREALAFALQLHALSVDTASNGEEAIGCLGAAPRPCMILLDLMMPIMDGFQFRRWQLGSAVACEIPTVAVSGNDAGLREMHDLGVTECLAKPVEIQRVLKLIERCCAHRTDANVTV